MSYQEFSMDYSIQTLEIEIAKLKKANRRLQLFEDTGDYSSGSQIVANDKHIKELEMSIQFLKEKWEEL